MALIRVAQYSSTPTVVGDYQAQNAHLQAFTNQLMTQQFILDSGTAQPVIKQGCYVSHGGSLYVADADTAITGSPADGSVYIRVSGTTSLTVEFVTDISGYAWNPVYTALTSGSYTLLPYLIVKASTVWVRYNFNPNNQAFGDARLNSLAVTGAITGASVGVTGAISGASINTGYGDALVYKITYVNYGTLLTTSVTMDAMEIGEFRFVLIGFSGGTGAELIAPSEGSYIRTGIATVFSGGSALVSAPLSGSTSNGIIVRRIS